MNFLFCRAALKRAKENDLRNCLFIREVDETEKYYIALKISDVGIPDATLSRERVRCRESNMSL